MRRMVMNNLELLSNALDYIEDNISEKITAENVADACYCSKSCLQKLFKYVNGYSIKEYVIKRRITKAAKDLVCDPSKSILEIAFQYCYNSPEAFTRAFEQVWRCKPSIFRKEARFTDLYPRLLLPIKNGDEYMKDRKHVDISELYDLFTERKECYFVCCDIKSLVPINEISRKAGDLAILEVLRRMEKVAGADDIVFRIGGDEFVLLTNSRDITYASNTAESILKMNGQPIKYEGIEIPISVYAGVTRFTGSRLKYDELFIGLHNTIKECK
jgi:AraC family transcriptional regulator